MKKNGASHIFHPLPYAQAQCWSRTTEWKQHYVILVALSQSGHTVELCVHSQKDCTARVYSIFYSRRAVIQVGAQFRIVLLNSENY